tara:strand:- start:406 stop:1311 length:906 start_codon:yes stop_codon:yes gene_type:complete
MPKDYLLKLFYKIFDKNKYRDFKNKKRTEARLKYYNSHIYSKIEEIQKKIENNKEISFLHSGQLGDLIYSLATIKELSKNHRCKLFIEINKPMSSDFSDSSRKVYINERSGKLILPLLKSQSFLETVDIYKNEKIDIDLNLFRSIPINLNFYASRWFSHICGININVENTFLSVKPHDTIKNKIVIHRSPRYRNEYINYKFLNDKKNLLCIGLESEFRSLKKVINNLEFYNPKDFLEMAEIIKASKFFVGNMSFQYIIAEGLKVPRLLEASPDFPIVFPTGPNAYDSYHQNHFEKFFNILN